MAYQSLNYSNSEGIIRITLNRPPVNVLNIPMMEELGDALEAAGQDEGKVILLDAAGKAFSAGVDVADHTPDKVQKMVSVFGRIFRVMNDIQKPIICAVNGVALGGGCELVLACDMVVASEKAKFGQPEIAVGVFPPVAAYYLPRLVGYMNAMELLLSGETIDAKKAQSIGLVNKVVSVETFNAEVDSFLAKFLDKSPLVLALTKQVTKSVANLGVSEGLAATDKFYLEELMPTADAVEGLNAFLEKRKPVWTGK